VVFVRFLTLAACLLVVGCNRDPRILGLKCVTSGNKYFKDGKFKQASILYRRALQLNPKDPDAYYRLGLADMALQN
jgi:tetratricopeptide (TPR) repeat protein